MNETEREKRIEKLEQEVRNIERRLEELELVVSNKNSHLEREIAKLWAAVEALREIHRPIR